MKIPRQVSLAALVLVVAVLLDTVYVVDERDSAILLQFDVIKNASVGPGLHLKLPLMQTVAKFDRRMLTETGTENVPTSDQNTLQVDFYVQWKVADNSIYYRATGGNDQLAGDRLLAGAERCLRDTLGTLSVEQAVSGDRSQLSGQLVQQTQQKAQELGVQVVDVRIKSLGLPKDVASAYYERMRAERHRIAEEARARGAAEAETIRASAEAEAQTTLAEAYRKAETLRGEGDAKAAQIYAQAYGADPDFFAFYKSLEAYKEAFKGKRDVLVVEPKGQFFRYFNDPGSAK